MSKSTNLPKAHFIRYFIYSFLIAFIVVYPFISVKFNFFFFNFFSTIVNINEIGNTLSSLQNIIITVSVGLFGFLLTSLAIIVSFFNNTAMQAFSKTEGLDNLISTYKYTFIGIICSVIVALSAILFAIPINLALFSLILFLTYNIFSMFRCVGVLFIIVRNIARK